MKRDNAKDLPSTKAFAELCFANREVKSIQPSMVIGLLCVIARELDSISYKLREK